MSLEYNQIHEDFTWPSLRNSKESRLWLHIPVAYLPSHQSHPARFTVCLCHGGGSSLQPLGCRSSSRWLRKLPAAWWRHRVGWLEVKEKLRYMQVNLGRDFIPTMAQVLRASEYERKFSNESCPFLWRSCFAFRGSPGGFSWLSHFTFYQGPALPCRELVGRRVLLLKYSLSRGANLQICFCHQSGKKFGI